MTPPRHLDACDRAQDLGVCHRHSTTNQNSQTNAQPTASSLDGDQQVSMVPTYSSETREGGSVHNTA